MELQQFFFRAREWLHNHLPGRWIGRRGPLEWAARSPDLMALDFYLWGYVKQKVYKNYHNDLDELRTSITYVIHSIQPDVLKTVFSNISKRLNLVIQKNGAHIEQFLYFFLINKLGSFSFKIKKHKNLLSYLFQKQCLFKITQLLIERTV